MPAREMERSFLNIKRCISVRHFGPYEDVSETWAKLTQLALLLGIGGPDLQAFGVCYDDPTTTPVSQIRYDACLSLNQEQGVQVRDRVSRGVQAGDAALRGVRVEEVQFAPTNMTVHKGSYKDVRRAYEEIAVYAKQNNLRGVAPPFIEVYRNNPLLSSPSDLFTEIHFGQA